MKHLENKTKGQLGFTLIELSIVLVIIGLIVGGVLVGQDLIRAAEIRATVSQLEKYNSAVNTFRGKYNALPGDINCQYAFQFGFTAGQTGSCTGTMVGTAGLEDGNGLIEATGGGNAVNIAAGTGFSGEEVMFWNHLTVANLLDGNFSSTAAAVSTTVVQPAAATTVATTNLWIPPAKMGRGNNFAVFAQKGINYFEISGFNTLNAGAIAETNAMTPIEARNIDAKIDDGLPLSGVVMAAGTGGLMAAPITGAVGTTGNCGTGTAPSTTYDVSANGAGAGGNPGNQTNCGIYVRFN